MKNQLVVKKNIDLKKKTKSFKNLSVKVGFPKESPKTQDKDDKGVSAVFKATVNNFGLGVPKRPFMDIAYARNKREYRKIVIKSFKKIEDLDMIKFANQLGLKAQGDVQKEIVSLRSPANNEKTIESKGSSNPLIDTGNMLQSVTFAVIEKDR